MELNNYEMKAFRAIVEANGFNKASDILFITQSSVSQSLSNLENKLGQQLIIRKSPLQLTEAGKRLLSYAHNAFGNEKIMLAELEDIKNGIDVTLSIAINSAINRYSAPALLMEFCDQHPSARLNVDIFLSREIIYVVLEGKKNLDSVRFKNKWRLLTEFHCSEREAIWWLVRTTLTMTRY